MGWNLCIATERDREQAKLLEYNEASNEEDDYDEDDLFNEGVTSLSREFSYALLRDHGQLWKGLSQHELKALAPDDIDYPNHWRSRNPQQLLEILCRVRERLERENEQMPVDHFLWYVDERGERGNGSTQITLPFGGIELKAPHDPIVKLVGSHHDPDHRWELRKYDMHVDTNLLAQFNREIEDFCTEHGINSVNSSFSIPNILQVDPLVAEPVGWIPVQPVLEVLGYRVEVESVDALSSFEPDLNTAIECCEQAISIDTPFYWLVE